ncbi:MAG TPA: sugar-binding protein [Bacteroidales bacterium]|nr:sugar-binding protein [Bacteroidales bacterium]
MKSFFSSLLCILIFGLTPVIDTIGQEYRHYTCYRTAVPVKIDGVLEESDWARAEWSQEFVDISGDPAKKPALRTRVKMLWDDSCLYVAAEINEPQIWGTLHQRDTVIFQDNDFEIFLDPEGNGTNYYELEVNALGTVWDLMLTRPYKDQGQPLNGWDLNGLRTGIHINGSLNDPARPDTSWIVEMALPLRELMKGKKKESAPAEGVQWRINFSRVEWETGITGSSYRKKTDPATGKPLPEHNWAWSPMGEVSMHIPDRWGWLEFSSEDITPKPLQFNSEQQRNKFRIWVWMNGHDDWNNQKWDSVLTLLHTSGVEGILVQANPFTLERIIPLAHRHRILVEKWFIAMMNNDTSLIRNYPQWFVVNREGKSCITDPAYVGYYRFLCPSNPEVRSYLASRIEDYLAIPGLDGIHLDYIRYPDVILPRALWTVYGVVQDKEYAPYDYCYCTVCRDKFRLMYGKDPLLLDHPETNISWRQFRYNQVTSLVGELSDLCHQEGKKLSAAVFPGPTLAKQMVRQAWDQWALDEVMPMQYQNFYRAPLDWIRSETEEGTASLGKEVPLFSGLYIPALNPRELQTAIYKSIEGGASGIALFNYEAMSPRHWKILKDLFGK